MNWQELELEISSYNNNHDAIMGLNRFIKLLRDKMDLEEKLWEIEKQKILLTSKTINI